MPCRSLKNVSHLVSLRVGGPNCIISDRKSYRSIVRQFNDDNNALIPSVKMRGIVVLGIGAERDTFKDE